jgi:hypothetical protein
MVGYPAVAAPEYSHLVGHTFPGGSYTLLPFEAWLWADAAEAKPDPAAAHPGIAYLVGLHGGGASIQDIMDLLETDAHSGVMFGEVAFEFGGAIEPGATYHVDGEIVDIDRKQGRRAGQFDRVTFVHRLRTEPGSEPVTQVTHTWIIPRPEPAA